MNGAIRVDFAGSRVEAVAYAKEHQLSVARVPSGEHPQLIVRFSNAAQMSAAKQKLTSLGSWTADDLEIINYGRYQRGASRRRRV